MESVNTEVEEKQKRLFQFTSAFEELSRSPMASFSDTNVRQDFPEGSLLPKEKWEEPSKNKESQPRKYAMDHECPAADLERDPVLNYSAGLLEASEAKQVETDTQHFCGLKKSAGENYYKSLESPRPYVSPIRIKINLQDSDEDDLVIDVPPIMPTSKKSRPFRDFRYQNMDERLHIMPPEKRNLQISGTEEEKIDKTQLATQIDDDNNKLEPPKSLMNSTLDIKSNIKMYSVKNHISRMRSFDEKKYVCISEESICCAPLSDTEIQNKSHNESYAKSKKHMKTIDDTRKEETECRCSASQPQSSYSGERAKDSVLSVPDDSRDFTTCEDSKLVEFDFDKEHTEDDTPSDSDDALKECLQIFSEFTESQAWKGEAAKQASGKQMELDMPYYQNVSGPKRRIAHIAKFDVPTSKEIISPFRGPGPPLMSPAGILPAQQQAEQIMAAVRSGQAFVAATSEQKKSMCACPASQTQRRASGENALTSDSLHLDVVLSRENPVAKPSRSHVPVKSIASFPVKMPRYKVAHGKRTFVTSESSSKVPDEVRQRYVNLFFEKYLRVYKTEDEAFSKAKIEEKAIYERCGSKNMYVNIAIHTLKKLRNQDVSGSSNDNKTTGLKKNEKKNVLTGISLYRRLKDYLLTEEDLHKNNYPQPNPDKPGSVLLNPSMTKTLVNDASKKICLRCGKIYDVTSGGRHGSGEECNYHFGGVLSQKGKYLVVLFHLFDTPVPQLFREKWSKEFSSIYIC
ncbi:RNA exonuclease 1 homolog [Diceros bicornis minor]|uniref:RNA exonuclease 1 homolog n=1 Tax=Diceros bicornis minor TaxID=77932 RepID=UPI0026F1D14D|nr:RNA exonuclease 1 homolog [Diceros bicornis minor]XP_058421908.1 RNA exonuclease 1 homolog [Diceros bicornis minor]